MKRLFLVLAFLVSSNADAQISYPGTRSTDSSSIARSTSTTEAVKAAKRWLSWSSPHLNAYNSYLAALARRDTVRLTTVIHDTVRVTRVDTVYVSGSGGGSTTTTTSGLPNMPIGLTQITNYSGGSLVAGISEITQSTSLVSDATAPRSPSDVRRYNIPALTQAQYDALVAGTSTDPMGWQRGGGIVGVTLPVGGVNEVYVARWLKPGTTLVGDDAGSKSLMLGWSGGIGGSIYFNYETTPDFLIRPLVSAPRIYSNGEQEDRNDRWLTRNIASTPIVRGTWGLWEFYAKLNDPGQRNGIIRVWCNGVLQLEYTNWLFIPTGSAARFTSLKSDFYQNRAQLFPMWIDMDHMFVAGR